MADTVYGRKESVLLALMQMLIDDEPGSGSIPYPLPLDWADKPTISTLPIKKDDDGNDSAAGSEVQENKGSENQ